MASVTSSVCSPVKNKYISYSSEQKHMFLFMKSTLRGCYKPRHVTKLDVVLFEYLNYKKVTCPSPVSNMSFGQSFEQPTYLPMHI